MKPLPGLQLWSVRNALMEDYAGTMEKVAEIGYKNIELICNVTSDGLVFGKDTSATELRKLFDRLGLKAINQHFVPTPETPWEKVIADCHTTGVEGLVCAIAFFETKQEVYDFCKAINQQAALCKQNGLQYYYHNHFHEYQVMEGEKIMDILINELDPALVKFEFDIYWTMRGGEDPVVWMKKLGKRCDLLHQKDIPTTGLPLNWFDQFGYDTKIGFDQLWLTQDVAQFTEIGDGIIDIPAVLSAARQYCDPRYVFVEQDMSKMGELESIAVSYKNLTRILNELPE